MQAVLSEHAVSPGKPVLHLDICNMRCRPGQINHLQIQSKSNIFIMGYNIYVQLDMNISAPKLLVVWLKYSEEVTRLTVTHLQIYMLLSPQTSSDKWLLTGVLSVTWYHVDIETFNTTHRAWMYICLWLQPQQTEFGIQATALEFTLHIMVFRLPAYF